MGDTAEQTTTTVKTNEPRRMRTEICAICMCPGSIELLARIDIVGVEQLAHEVCITTLPPRTIRLIAWSTRPPTLQYRDEIAATQTIVVDT